jgi:alpha-D-ribose 1-methylphosphonate 5-triphosphate synthase subunit PhnL
VAPGECVALTGESGAGKSTVMRILYGNYLAAPGSTVRIGGLDLTRAAPREILALRRETLGYVSSSCASCPGCPRRRGGRAASGAGPSAGGGSAGAGEELLERLRIPARSGRCRPRPFRAASSSA